MVVIRHANAVINLMRNETASCIGSNIPYTHHDGVGRRIVEIEKIS